MYGVLIFTPDMENFVKKFPLAQLLNVHGSFVQQNSGVFFLETKEKIGLELMQSIVDGHIEAVGMEENLSIDGKGYGLDLWVNEEFSFRTDLEWNFAVLKCRPDLLIQGNMFVALINDAGESKPMHLSLAVTIAKEKFLYKNLYKYGVQDE